MTNADRKAAIRERMASTGENYTTARRAIEQARGHARKRVNPRNDLALEQAVYAAHDLARQILALPGNDPRILRMESAARAITDVDGELPTTSEITRTIGFSWGYPSLDELLDRYAQEHTRELEQLKQYIANTWWRGATPAAQRISEALNIGLDEVLAAIQKLGPWGPAVALAGEGTLMIGAPTAGAAAGAPRAAVLVTDADVGAATESLEVVRQIDADELSERASRDGLARLSTSQRILVAAILIAAVLPALPPEARQAIMEYAGLMAAITAVLPLLKR
jgi:hypothetical protein